MLMPKHVTTSDFIEKAKKIHGDKYNYSKVEYVNAHTKVCIICPEHGEFWQIANTHLNGSGCPKCAIIETHKKQTLTTVRFINKAQKIHKNKYIYKKTEYKNATSKVIITCPIHGDFKQIPSDHLSGKGCPRCCGKFFTTKEWIEKFKEVHGNKYIYTKVNYINSKTKVCIICPEHGEFWQIPAKHLYAKQGCPKCKQSHLEKNIEKYLIDNDIKFETQKKFEWLGKQSLDFYLPDYNVAIECQGEQHFTNVDFGNKGNEFAQKEYNETIKRDKRKLKLCLKNGIKIFYYAKLNNNDTFLNNKVYTNIENILSNIKKNNYG